MLTSAFIEEYGNGRMEAEMSDLYSELMARGFPVERFTEKRMQRRQLPLTKQTLVAGAIPVVLGALKQLEIDIPEPNDYPECLSPYLRRRIWTSTVGTVQQRLEDAMAGPIFVKPKGRLKRFTGNVMADLSDLRYFEGASRTLPVYCSEIVSWQSEWRVFVVHKTIVGIRHYAGDSSLRVDEGIVREAVDTWEHTGNAHAAYAIDFGVLNDGSTALVELNDGFSIGSYGLNKSLYTDLTIARWYEMVGLQ